jgi:hypothetical protein
MSGHIGQMQLVTSEFLSADDCLKAGNQLHLILLNYVLPPQTATLWQRGNLNSCLWHVTLQVVVFLACNRSPVLSLFV